MDRRGPAALLLLALTACAPPDVAGSWDGTWRSGVFEGDMDLALTQDEGTLGGTFELGGTWCVGSGTIAGTLENREITLTLTNEVGGTIEITGRVNATDDRIEGDFEVTGGFCEDAKGKVDLERG